MYIGEKKPILTQEIELMVPVWPLIATQEQDLKVIIGIYYLKFVAISVLKSQTILGIIRKKMYNKTV